MKNLEVELTNGMPVIVSRSQEKGEPLSNEVITLEEEFDVNPAPFSEVSKELNIGLNESGARFIGSRFMYESLNN